MEPEFPLEIVVSGTPVSLGASARSRAVWKEFLKTASRPLLAEGHWATVAPISVTVFYFPAEPMEGDIDNIVKPILDAFNNWIYSDDHQVERVVVQKFEPNRIFVFGSASETLADVIAAEKPKLYIRISTDPFEDLQ
ncbi:MAG: RusA family crossover junction endodeoxyribonuclease [Rhizobiaceae bacterium]|nr:RusA family crossover junction endodeoxyribonuclease [Rhizobiaceae bacterium]